MAGINESICLQLRMDDAIASDASRQAQFLSEIASQGINLSLDLLQRAGGLYAIQTSSTIDGRPYYVRRHGDSAFIMCATPSHHREYARTSNMRASLPNNRRYHTRRTWRVKYVIFDGAQSSTILREEDVFVTSSDALVAEDVSDHFDLVGSEAKATGMIMTVRVSAQPVCGDQVESMGQSSPAETWVQKMIVNRFLLTFTGIFMIGRRITARIFILLLVLHALRFMFVAYSVGAASALHEALDTVFLCAFDGFTVCIIFLLDYLLTIAFFVAGFVCFLACGLNLRALEIILERQGVGARLLPFHRWLARVGQPENRDGRRDADAGRVAIHWPPPIHVANVPPHVDPPAFALCPITYTVMTEPAITPRGTTYDRAALEEWIVTKHRYPSQEGSEALSVGDLAPNFAVRNLIEEWAEEQRAID